VALAFAIAWRNHPIPLSLAFVTVSAVNTGAARDASA
jgi:hypothetical protein